MSKSKPHWFLEVVLGTPTIKAFVAVSKEFNILGIVRLTKRRVEHGRIEFGVLATTQSGAYVRVNGSTIQHLDKNAVEEAISLARLNGRGQSYADSRQRMTSIASTPSVTVRKRRHVSQDLAHQGPYINAQYTELKLNVASI